MKYTTIKATDALGANRVWTPCGPDGLPFPETRKIIGGGDIEFVSVLFGGKACTMVVDEMGATDWKLGYPLPVNPGATEIYHANSKARGMDTSNAPLIHGDVVLYDARLS